MNIDLLFPALTGDLAQLGQAAQGTEPGQEGQEFEDMLLQQSKAAQAQRREEKPAKKPEEKKEPAKPQEKSTQDKEIAEKGGQLAAALVTSQPVVHFELLTAAGTDTAITTGPLEGVASGLPVEVFEGFLEPEAAVEETGEVLPQMPELQPEVQPEAAVQVQPETAAVEEEAAAPVVPQEAQTQEAPRMEEQPEVQVHRVQVENRDTSREETADENAFGESVPVFHDVKAAPVKVGEVHRPVDVEEPDAPQQLAGQITQALERGETTVQIQLNPANLGSVTVELTRDAAGQLSIWFHPETARAAAILQEHSGALLNTLHNSGEPAVIVAVATPEETENAGMFLNPDGKNRQDQEEDDDERKKRRTQPRTEGVSASDFLSQLRLGLVDAQSIRE